MISHRLEAEPTIRVAARLVVWIEALTDFMTEVVLAHGGVLVGDIQRHTQARGLVFFQNTPGALLEQGAKPGSFQFP